MKTQGIKVAKVTRAFLVKAARFYLQHPLVPFPKTHIAPPSQEQVKFASENWGLDVRHNGEDVKIADSFKAQLNVGETYTEGFRYGVSGWMHTKLRFTVNDKGLFRFYIHANVDSLHYKDVIKTCRKIARDMNKAGFPTWTGR